LIPHDPEKWEPVFGQDHAATGLAPDLVCELLTQSLAAWRVEGRVARGSDGTLSIDAASKSIRIEPSRHAMFRWMVTLDGRTRAAISVVAVLRQVREAVDPRYAASRVRIAVAPLVPSQ
jgi:hypothetical protein